MYKLKNNVNKKVTQLSELMQNFSILFSKKFPFKYMYVQYVRAFIPILIIHTLY